MKNSILWNFVHFSTNFYPLFRNGINFCLTINFAAVSIATVCMVCCLNRLRVFVAPFHDLTCRSLNFENSNRSHRKRCLTLVLWLQNLVTFCDYFARIIFASNCFFRSTFQNRPLTSKWYVAHVIRDETLFTGSKIDPKSKARAKRAPLTVKGMAVNSSKLRDNI